MKNVDIRAATMKLAMDQLRSLGALLYTKKQSGVYKLGDVVKQIKDGDWNQSYAATGQIRDQTAQTTTKGPHSHGI